MDKQMSAGGCYGDIWTWVHDEDVMDRIFRVWFDPIDGREYHLMRLAQIISLPDGEVLIGLQYPDSKNGGRLDGAIWFHKLSNITLAYFPSDNESKVAE